MTSPSTRLRFGSFVFDPQTGDLTNGDVLVRLQPQPTAVLALLTARAGELVSRREIQERVWPDTHVEVDQGVNYCIRQLRAALGDDSSRPAFIETLPRRGYRFIAPVTTVDPRSPEAPAVVPGQGRTRRPGRVVFRLRGLPAALAIVAVTLVTAAAVGMAVVGRHAPPPVMLAVLPFDTRNGALSEERLSRLLAEALTTDLARDAATLGVLGPTSTGAYGITTPVPEIGAALGVDHVLSGAVEVTTTGYSVFAQLIRVTDLTHVWAGRYDGSLSGVDTSGNRIAAEIAAAVTAHLSER